MKKTVVAVGLLARLIAIILICMMIFSCHSTKQITQNKSDISERKNIELAEKKENNTQIYGQIETNENLNIIQSIIENMLFTIWSVPDSLGKQHPAVTGEINRRENTEQTGKKDTSTNTKTSTIGKEQADFKDNTKTDSKSDVKEVKENEKKAPAWLIWPATIIIFGLIIYLFRIFKK